MPIDPSEITPTLSEIGEKIKVHTRDADGVVQNTFTNTTVPDAEEAGRRARAAALFVASRVGSPSVRWTDDLKDQARDAAAAYAALMIASDVAGDESREEDSRLDQLGRMAREQIRALRVVSANNAPGGMRFNSIKQVNR